MVLQDSSTSVGSTFTQNTDKNTVDTRSYVLQLISLFDYDHRYTNERLAWVCFWAGTKEFEQGTITKGTLETRIEFLRSVWSNFREFRPFDNVQNSERYLKSCPDIGFILRLSTSQPGKITFTRRNEGRILHTRFTIFTGGGLVNAAGNIYNNISELAQELSQKLAVSTPSHHPAEYRPNEVELTGRLTETID